MSPVTLLPFVLVF